MLRSKAYTDLKWHYTCERTDDHVFATYLVAVVLQMSVESCDEIPSGGFRWITLETFYPNYYSLPVCVSCLYILFPSHLSLASHLFRRCWTWAPLSQQIKRVHQCQYQNGSSVSPWPGWSWPVRLSCGRAGGNLKVLWKTKSGPAAAASCWPTLFRGSRYRLMTGLLLSGPHY